MRQFVKPPAPIRWRVPNHWWRSIELPNARQFAVADRKLHAVEIERINQWCGEVLGDHECWSHLPPNIYVFDQRPQITMFLMRWQGVSPMDTAL